MDPFMKGGIRWLRFNGGRRRWIMEGKGDKARKKHLGERYCFLVGVIFSY
jgi:hypothetical protein